MPDPLAAALERKAIHGERGGATQRVLAAGDGWRVLDIVCTSGPADRPFEECQPRSSISLVLSGTFAYRGARGSSLLSPGALLLVNEGRPFECSHRHGEGDRCLSFQFESDLFERLAHDAGASRAVFEHDRVPPLRGLAPHVARAALAASGGDVLEELALELAGAALTIAAGTRRGAERAPSPAGVARVARVLRAMEADAAAPHALDDLARMAGMSRYHFLRTFKAVTGVTPHQWLLRARLRDAALRLATTGAPVTEVALDAGFDDLSNFIRTFRAEFGASPRTYRVSARAAA
ncbi:MAG: AraC family transcriptional regulator [Thermodesulfobacteriota bacterium]